MSVSLTEVAAEKVRGFLADETDTENIGLRISVQAGGCSGFRYAMFFDDRDLDSDTVIETNGVLLKIDKQSFVYMEGTVIDWKESLEMSGFNIENPQSSNLCACGKSASF